MGIILKGEHERAARSKRGDLMNIPSSEAEQKNIKMGEGGRKLSQLVIYNLINTL